jgi:hypothetical protein
MLEQGKETVESFFHYNQTVEYPTNTMAPEDCRARLDSDSGLENFWGLVYAMVALTMLTILMRYLFFCCSKWTRCFAKLYGLAGTFNFLVGILMVSVLLPECPPDCGVYFCRIHHYNPGPIYGCVVMFMGVLWWCKACQLRRQAAREEVEKEAQRVMAEDGKELTGSVV